MSESVDVTQYGWDVTLFCVECDTVKVVELDEEGYTYGTRYRYVNEYLIPGRAQDRRATMRTEWLDRQTRRGGRH